MSDDSEQRHGQSDPGAERRDALISAGIDGALEPSEREELAALLAGEDGAAERDRAFRRVDEALRKVAHESIRDARLDELLANMQNRIEADASGSDGGFLVRRWPFAAVAAAALFVFYLLVPSTPPRVEDSSSLADAPVDDSFMAEDLVLAIGYGDELSELGGIPNEDFEVIEQLELLDYMLGRESREDAVPDRDMEDRG